MAPQNGNHDAGPPRFLIIGAGSRGNTYARAIKSTNGIVAAVADPVEFKRRELGRKYIWGDSDPLSEQEFLNWRVFVEYEEQRRRDALLGRKVSPAIDGVFICVLDEQHAEVIAGLAPLNLHIMSEKPLATTLKD
ncbi:hypothetical protein LTR28_001926, partial [Elasticomyces elasticus]